MQDRTFRIDAIRAHGALDQGITSMLEDIPGWSEADWKDTPPPIIGWYLTLMHGERLIGRQDFPGGDDGFRQAQEAGKTWLATHGKDSISQWLAGSSAAMRRMNHDPDFRHHLSKRGF